MRTWVPPVRVYEGGVTWGPRGGSPDVRPPRYDGGGRTGDYDAG